MTDLPKPHVEYDHTGSGLPRYTLYYAPPRDGQSDTIVKQPFYNGLDPKRWADDLLAWLEGISLETPIVIGSHVTAETVGDIVERVKETGFDRSWVA